jgi:hypothetical protein
MKCIRYQAYAASEKPDEKFSGRVGDIEKDKDKKALARSIARPHNAGHNAPEFIIFRILDLGVFPQEFSIVSIHNLLAPAPTP